MKKMVIIIIIIVILGFLFLRYKSSIEKSVLAPKNPVETAQTWPWPEYPEHFKDVDCATVPDKAIGWPQGNDVPTDLRNVCWKERIWNENNWQLCEHIWLKGECYAWMAIKLKDENLCNNEKVSVERCKNTVKLNVEKNSYEEYFNSFRNSDNPLWYAAP